MTQLTAIDLELLRKGFELLNIKGAEEAFVEYFNLLQKWNRTYNLTAISNSSDIIIKHFFDSLSLRPYLFGKRILDIGTGAGFPGIPLAIVEPERKFFLLDSQIKKIHFLETVKNVLKLTHVEIIHTRVEDFAPKEPFDTVLCRAFGSLSIIYEKTKHLLAPESHMLAMKGQYPTEELSQFGGDKEWVDVIALDVPYLPQQRHVVRFIKKS